MTRRRGVRAAIALACVLAVGTVSVIGGQAPALAYPDIYRARQLPELPNATIVSTGRQTASLRDGLRLQLTSPRPLAEVRDFYRSALTKQEWKIEDSPASRAAASNTRLSLMTFTKDALTYAVTVTSLPGTQGTEIQINVLEGAVGR